MANDGGPAFPEIRIEQRGDPVYEKPTRVYFGGMSLRDWFAGKALQGLLASMSTKHACNNLAAEMSYRKDPSRRPEWTLARVAYHYANAMIAERSKEATNEQAESN